MSDRQTTDVLSLRMDKKRSFTLIEIVITVGIIGILAILAYPYFYRPLQLTQKNKCFRNQQLIYSLASLYELEVGSLYDFSQAGRLDALYQKGYFKNQEAFNCPSNRNRTNADYVLVYDANRKLIDVTCAFKPVEHTFSSPGGSSGGGGGGGSALEEDSPDGGDSGEDTKPDKEKKDKDKGKGKKD